MKEKLKKIKNLAGYVAIDDFVMNYVFRFEQDDGQLAFPYKKMAKYHLVGKLSVCSLESLLVALDHQEFDVSVFMPAKSGRGYHLLGDVTVCIERIFIKQMETVMLLLEATPGPLHVVAPPQPRYLFSS